MGLPQWTPLLPHSRATGYKQNIKIETSTLFFYLEVKCFLEYTERALDYTKGIQAQRFFLALLWATAGWFCNFSPNLEFQACIGLAVKFSILK